MFTYEQNCVASKNQNLLAALSKPIQPYTSIIQQSFSVYNIKSKCKSEIESLLNKVSESQLKQAVPIRSHHRIKWTWNKIDSNKMMFSNDSKSVCLHPYCSGCFETDAVRGDQALKKNAYTYWQIEMGKEALSGTSSMIGVGTSSAKLNSFGYLNLIGMDENSWGLSNKGLVWNGNNARSFCNQFDESENVKIGCLFDGFNGRLSYFINGVYMGVAFQNLPLNVALYPMVSSTVARSVFKLDFVFETFPSLQDICRSKINQSNEIIDKSSLPKSIIDFLKN